MKLMKPLMIVFAIILLPFVALSCAQLFGWTWPLPFTGANVVMAVCLSIFAVLLVIAAFGQKFRLKRIGSYLLHFGFLLFLVGCLLYVTTGKSLTVAVPVDRTKAYSYLQDSDGNVVELGFAFGVDDFWITYYDPVYDVYRTDGTALRKDVQIQTAANGDLYYDFEEYGAITLQELLDGETIDTIRKTVTLADNVVARVRLPVKAYTANITFIGDNGAETTKQLLVNQPLYKNEFKIYLMGYDEMTSRVTLMLKKDIGEPLSTAGLVTVMAGTFFQCIVYPLLEKRGKQKRLSEWNQTKEDKK